MTTAKMVLPTGRLTLADLRRILAEPVILQLDEGAWATLEASRDVIERKVAAGEVTYGVNTGFGRLAHTRIDDHQLGELQSRLIQSHAAGVGEPLDPATVRLILALKINSLCRGFSGVRREVVESLLALLEHEVYPHVPSQGSVGASGDLAPLAHLALPLLGMGQAWVEGRWVSGREALDRAGLEPLELHAKEGLALLNGTQVSTALALRGLFEAEQTAAAALATGALSVEAALGSRTPFDPRIHRARGQHGQIAAAAILRQWLGETSALGESHADCRRVQDPYCLRCQPQVMGACLDQLRAAAEILGVEANAASDNPLIFPEEEEVLSGGNFHAEPVALAADGLALAIAEIGALSERRQALLVDPSLSQLPAFLVAEPGLNSGFMIAQVTSAALASENKSLAHPGSVDSIPTSANQEDHVSMATGSARRLIAMNDNTRRIVAIELLAAAQGIDFRRPLRSTEALEAVHARVRAEVDPWDQDRFFAPDIEAATQVISEGHLGDAVAAWIDREVARRNPKA